MSFPHSCGETVLMVSPTFLQTASRVLSAAFRMAFLTLANIISMGASMVAGRVNALLRPGCGPPDRFSLVGAEVVHVHDIAGFEDGDQEPFDPCRKPQPVYGSVEHARGFHRPGTKAAGKVIVLQ